MTLKVINNAVKIKTTIIVNGDMGFSYLSDPYTYTVASHFCSLSDKTQLTQNRCLQNP